MSDDGGAEDKKEDHRPLHGIGEHAVHLHRRRQENAGEPVDHVDDEHHRKPEYLIEPLFTVDIFISEVEEGVAEEQQTEDGNVIPDLHGRPQLHTHEQGAAGPEDHGDQHQEEGVDHPAFTGGQHGHEEEDIAEQCDNRYEGKRRHIRSSSPFLPFPAWGFTGIPAVPSHHRRTD